MGIKKYIIKDIYDTSVITTCIHDRNIIGFIMEMLRFCAYPESYSLEDDDNLRQYNIEALSNIFLFLKEGLDYNPRKIEIANKIYQMAVHFFIEANFWEKLQEAHLCFWYILVEDWNRNVIQLEKNPFNIFVLNFIFTYNCSYLEKEQVNFPFEKVKKRWEKYIKKSLISVQFD